MTPLEIMMIAQGLLDLYLKLKPSIEAGITSGQIGVEQQLILKAKIDAIRSGEAFQGPQWKVE